MERKFTLTLKTNDCRISYNDLAKYANDVELYVNSTLPIRAHMEESK